MYKTRHAWFFLIPVGVFLLVFNIFPGFWALVLSFTNYNVFQPLNFIGFDNYIKVLNDKLFWKALFNTFYYWILVTPALVILPVFIAVLVNQKLKGINLYRLIYYFPVLVSMVIVAIIWGWMFKSDGILNYFLSLFGIPAVDWLTSKNLSMPSLGLVTIWQGLGYYMLIYLAGLQSIPNDLYEAAELDGAGFWKKQWYVTFPMLKPILFFVAVITTLRAFKEFQLMLVMTEGGPLDSTTTGIYLVFKEAFEKFEMGYASAISFLMFIFILILTIINRTLLDDSTKN